MSSKRHILVFAQAEGFQFHHRCVMLQGAYVKILESSQTLLEVIKRERQTMKKQEQLMLSA